MPLLEARLRDKRASLTEAQVAGLGDHRGAHGWKLCVEPRRVAQAGLLLQLAHLLRLLKGNNLNRTVDLGRILIPEVPRAQSDDFSVILGVPIHHDLFHFCSVNEESPFDAAGGPDRLSAYPSERC